MSQPRDLERAAERYVREVDMANRDIVALVNTIREIEQLAAAADVVDLRSNFALKSDLARLGNEVNELRRNLQALASELSDTNSKIRKALS
jgi:hypothetical protein